MFKNASDLKKRMAKSLLQTKKFRTNARSGLGLWKNIEGNNGSSRIVEYKLTESGREHLSSNGVSLWEILSYERFSDLIKEHELKPTHYQFVSEPLIVAPISDKMRRDAFGKKRYRD